MHDDELKLHRDMVVECCRDVVRMLCGVAFFVAIGLLWVGTP